MILAEFFTKFGFYEAIESGLYFIIVGYYILLFAYFLLMRYRTSKKLYWLFFTLLFLCLAIGRVFFISYYFFVPEIGLTGMNMALALMVQYRLATFFTWMGVACLMGVLGMLLFPPETEIETIEDKKSSEKSDDQPSKRFDLTPKAKLALRIILIAVPIVVGILVLSLPNSLLMDPKFLDPTKDEYIPGLAIQLDVVTFGDWSYPIGRLIVNFILLPLLVILIPFIFLYLAVKTFGVLRRSYLLNAIGFLLYFIGRMADGLFDALGWKHVSAIAPPLLILLSLLIIVIANNYEQLK
jgi:hypothetical protein